MLHQETRDVLDQIISVSQIPRKSNPATLIVFAWNEETNEVLHQKITACLPGELVELHN
jgi:hypothetical protein